MPITIQGLNSVINRTLFTNNGPIVKPPVPVLTGSNLTIISPTQVQIPTGIFNSSYIGYTIQIQGSPGARNDGTFFIVDVPNSTTLTLESADFDYSDPDATLASVITLVNNLSAEFSAHVVNSSETLPWVHGQPDDADVITVEDAVNLPTLLQLVNQIRVNFLNHIVLVGPPPTVHQIADLIDTVYLPAATNLPSALILANALRNAYELHRESPVYHYERDLVDRMSAPLAQIATGTGILVGPWAWTVFNPQIGVVADDPTDVTVYVNGSPVSIDAVFGLLGAIVLTNQPGPVDQVSVDYSWLNDPPTQIQRLNSPEFVLNQAGSGGLAGWPGHLYRSRSTLINPANPATILSAVQPLQTGWKYRALERNYSAVLNDPTTLLLNVPTNKVFYPVLDTQVVEQVIRYDPTSLPNQTMNPWTLEGQGIFSLAPGGAGLTIIDNDPGSGPTSQPPFYTYPIDLEFSSTISAAFRMSISATVPDGCFTGVAFGISDGQKVAVAAFLQTDSTNLSSAIVMTNNLLASFNAHLIQTGVHRPNDTIDTLELVNCVDLPTMIILINAIVAAFNNHVSYGGGYIHLLADLADQVSLPAASDLPSAIALINQTRISFNTHLTAPGIHYNNDTVNTVGLVQQVGFLMNGGFPELETSWNCGAVDWSETATYRVYRDSTGDVSLYISGSVTPIASLAVTDLPAASDVDIELNPMQQVFFGSIGRQATSTSVWNFIRVDVNPVDSDQLGGNKSVDYQAATLPELDPIAPWITIGQAGDERLTAGNLVLDSTASAPAASIAALGLTTGAYRGFLRLEPSLTRGSVSAIECMAYVGFYTFSLDNKAAGIFLDDDTFSTWLLFLQNTPSAATVTGNALAPFSIVAGNTAVLAIDGEDPITITFTSSASTAAQVTTVMNAAAGFTLAALNSAGNIVLTSETLGATSSLQLFGGVVFQALGIELGTYFGRDSNPEPKVSWFGENYPDQDTPQWTASGSQTAQLLGRTLRITDASTTDFRVYIQNQSLLTAPILNPATDWKLDFRLAVDSFTPGAQVVSGSNLAFSGVLVNIDEGTSGKNVELQYATDVFGGTYINVLSYNPVTGFLDQQAFFPFPWNDGNVHSIDLYTNKVAGLCIVLADNTILGNFSYPNLNAGIIGPEVTFGSGSSAVNNADLTTAQSVVDWKSVCIFRDLKVADPTAASRRFIGLYAGGDPSLLASYYTYQVDWTTPHIYRVVRDPQGAVSVFVDGNNVPVISVNYDSLRLPLVQQSFLQPITQNKECVAFGSFEPEEISRTVWNYLEYSIGKLTLTDLLITSHQVTNQANVVTSGEHLTTQVQHKHAGFNVYSGGSPTDEFMYNAAVPAATVLGEGTAPIPMTQDLDSRGGFVRTATPVENVPVATPTSPPSFVDTQGFLTDLENDLVNVTTFESAVVAIVNYVASAALVSFNEHMVRPNTHLVTDPGDEVAISVVDLPSAILAMNAIRTNYEHHRTAAGVHYVPDTEYAMSAPLANDLESLLTLIDDFYVKFTNHVARVIPHVNPDTIDTENLAPAVDLPSVITLSNDLQANYNAHLTQTNVHVINDVINTSFAPPCYDLATVIVLLTNLVQADAIFNAHLLYTSTATTLGAHKGIDRFNHDPDSPPVDLPSAITVANNLRLHYNQHLIQEDSHQNLDTTAALMESNADLPGILYTNTYLLLNQLVLAFNAHMTQYRVHVANDVNDIVQLPIVDLDSPTLLQDAIALCDALLESYSTHLSAVYNDSGSPVHVNDDVINVVTVPAGVPVTNVTDNAGLIQITTAVTGLTDDDVIVVSGVKGVPANGSFFADVLSTTTFLLGAPFFAGLYVNGGVVQNVSYPEGITVIGVTSNADSIQIETEPTTLVTGDVVAIAGVNGVPAANGSFQITVLTSTTFLLSNPTFIGNYTGGGLIQGISSLAVLVDNINQVYGLHLVQPTVHQNAVFIGVTPPAQYPGGPNVPYEQTEFYTTTTGTPGQLYPYSEQVSGVMLSQTLGSNYPVAISNVTNNGGVIEIDTATAPSPAFISGDTVVVSGVVGVPGANGTFTVIVLTMTRYLLQDTVFSGEYSNPVGNAAAIAPTSAASFITVF